MHSFVTIFSPVAWHQFSEYDKYFNTKKLLRHFLWFIKHMLLLKHDTQQYKFLFLSDISGYFMFNNAWRRLYNFNTEIEFKTTKKLVSIFTIKGDNYNSTIICQWSLKILSTYVNINFSRKYLRVFLKVAKSIVNYLIDNVTWFPLKVDFYNHYSDLLLGYNLLLPKKLKRSNKKKRSLRRSKRKRLFSSLGGRIWLT